MGRSPIKYKYNKRIHYVWFYILYLCYYVYIFIIKSEGFILGSMIGIIGIIFVIIMISSIKTIKDANKKSENNKRKKY